MDLPTGYTLRAPAPDDFDGVVDVLVADDLDDAGQVVLDEHFLRAEWRHNGFDLATDAWIVDDAAAKMLRARGLRPVRHFWHMGIDLEDPVAPGPAPAGIEIRSVAPRSDLPAMHAILTEAFSQDWGYHPEPFERWAEDYASGADYDPSLWLLATDGGAPAGALTAAVSGDHGWIGEIGVLPAHRGRGIAGALLGRSFSTFAGRGIRRVLLNVDAENPTGATGLYEREGMRVVKRWDLWEGRLDATA